MPGKALGSMYALLVVLTLAAVSLRTFGQGPTVPAASQSNSRLTVIISDLHMGVGRQGPGGTSGEWRPMEDFRWKQEFDDFLKEIDKGNTELILNGDTFELWQPANDGCVSQDPLLGCTETGALQRIQRVLKAHEDELAMLGRFAGDAGNRLVIVPGNHDAALLFKSVAQAVLGAIHAPSGKVKVAEAGFWFSDDRLLYAEHGHQIERPDSADENWTWPAPFIERDGTRYLQRSKEERTLQAYVNSHEEQVPVPAPIIDNTPEQEDALRIMLASEVRTIGASASGDVFGFVLFKTMWQDLKGTLKPADGKPPVWKLEEMKLAGDAALLPVLEADDPLRGAVQFSLDAGQRDFFMQQLSPDELRMLCSKQWIIWRNQEEEGKPHTLRPCPYEGSLSAAVSTFFRPRDKLFKKRLDQVYDNLEKAGYSRPRFKVFVRGSAHVPERGFQPRKGDWDPFVLTVGAWQRVATKKDLDRLRAGSDRKNLSDQEFLRSIKLEELPACYSFVRIDPYTNKPDPKLRYWVKGDNGKWQSDEKCR